MPITAMKKKADEARMEARSVCEINGSSSQACALAWEEVEEIQKAISTKQETNNSKSSLDVYCDENPEAPECRIYDF
ncbi:MAG: Calvin cycle protein CP12 [Prochloraceae cyanobacterium]|nr:Calvin cycle protein CP12 [Prochloraceae cyanobacterium]